VSAVAKAVINPSIAEANERRRSLRFESSAIGLIRLTANLTFRCQLRNISMLSAQVMCDPRYALLIHPQGGAVNATTAREFDLSVAFPIDGSVRSFAARARAVYCTEMVNSPQMLLGLEFVTLDVGARQLLANYIGNLRD
jgi:hypothetical protein